MSQNTMPVRIETDHLRQADDIARAMYDQDPYWRGQGAVPSRASVIRAAVWMGLEALADRYGLGTPKG